MRDITPKSLDFFIKMPDGSQGPLVAIGYTRLVEGGRGGYVEFERAQIIKEEFEVEPGQEYRLTEKYRKIVYYAWYRSKLGHRKLYIQYKRVTYADYLVSYCYIAPEDLIYSGQLYTETSNTALEL